MGDGDSLASGATNNRLRRSIRALRCFSRWSKQSKGPKIKPATSYVFPGAVAEDSWESADVDDDDFEVRTTSPPHSVDGRFDVSQALHPVPESLEEEEDETTVDDQQNQEPRDVDDAGSIRSKPSDYSSEFMTDDSTETSGLPWDSSFSMSHHGSAESTEEEELARIGIRPFEMPALNTEDQNREAFILESTSERNPSPTDANTHEKEEEQRTDSFGLNDDDTLNPDDAQCNEEDEQFIVRHSSSDAYSEEMRDALRRFSDSLPTTKSTEVASGTGTNTTSDFKSSAEKLIYNIHNGNKAKTPFRLKGTGTPEEGPPEHDTEHAVLQDQHIRKAGPKVIELMRKFGESSNKTNRAVRLSSTKKEEGSQDATKSRNDDAIEAPSDVPSVIISHGSGNAHDKKGFFWRSRPQLAAKGAESSHRLHEEDLVDTSISTTECNRSMDYSDVFSQEELDREYNTPPGDEPPFIHI